MTNLMEHATQEGMPVAQGDITLPARPADGNTRAGKTEDLKALHAELTTTYRDYLEMAKIKPTMLNPAMLGLIQQFLRHNDITAEAPQRSEVDALEKRLDQRRRARNAALARQGIGLSRDTEKE